jgi:hypothetical protein
MHIESGPTTERKVRTSLLLLLVVFFGAWFAYDGIRGYPGKNRTELIETLPVEQRAKATSAPVYARVNTENLELLLRAIKGGETLTTTVFKTGSLDEKRAFLARLFGGPPSFENDRTFYYFGPAWGVKFDVDSGSSLQVSPLKTQRSETDLAFQKGAGMVLGVLSLYLIFFVIRVRRTHAVLDDTGLTYNRTKKISWESMKALDSSRFVVKGWVDLIWDNGGVDDQLRLDEYHLANFNEILTAICEKKGFENPLSRPPEKEPPWQDDTPAPMQTA